VAGGQPDKIELGATGQRRERGVITLCPSNRLRIRPTVLRREIATTSASLSLRAWFESPQLYRARTRVDLISVLYLAAAASLIIAVDAERMLRRTAEQGSNLDVQICIDPGELAGELRSHLMAMLNDHLRHRNVHIEIVAKN
jgi:hypothetical protein